MRKVILWVHVSLDGFTAGPNGELDCVATASSNAGSCDAVSMLLDPLTPQERRVLPLLAEGASNQDIANALVISLATARKHVSNILSKLGVMNGTQAIARAGVRSALTQPPVSNAAPRGDWHGDVHAPLLHGSLLFTTRSPFLSSRYSSTVAFRLLRASTMMQYPLDRSTTRHETEHTRI